MKIEIKTLSGVSIPEYKTPGAAGFDLQADLRGVSEARDTSEGYPCVILEPFERMLIPTGIFVNIQNPGVALYVLPRSGLGSKGRRPANAPGLIDSDYQGEVMVAFENASNEPFTIRQGDRIAQGVFAPVFRPEFVQVDEFSTTTERGAGGFGSTGI